MIKTASLMDLSKFRTKGFQIFKGLYTTTEISELISFLDQQDLGNAFGVRRILRQYPELAKLLFTPRLRSIIRHIHPKAQVIRSLYFDKPPQANWIVNWHQDLTINVKQKKTLPNFKNWRVLPDRVVTRPPITLLENMFTLRIHLDDCNEQNGALRVIPASHQQGMVDVRNGPDSSLGKKHICEVPKGGVLLMSPLLLHSSRRTENEARRRVIHVELSDYVLPRGLEWHENLSIE